MDDAHSDDPTGINKEPTILSCQWLYNLHNCEVNFIYIPLFNGLNLYSVK